VIEVPKEVERIVTKEIEKIVTKEVPVPYYVEKVVEKVDRVEVPKEVFREVLREVRTVDRVREAHEHLFGMVRPQNTQRALEIYEEEAAKAKDPAAYNSLG
jgi:hypothetical protein